MTYLTDADRDELDWEKISSARLHAAVEKIVARVAAETRESVLGEVERAKADAWDACVAAATGGGLTPLADMLRQDNPYRDPRGGDGRG